MYFRQRVAMFHHHLESWMRQKGIRAFVLIIMGSLYNSSIDTSLDATWSRLVMEITHLPTLSPSDPCRCDTLSSPWFIACHTPEAKAIINPTIRGKWNRIKAGWQKLNISYLTVDKTNEQQFKIFEGASAVCLGKTIPKANGQFLNFKFIQ